MNAPPIKARPLCPGCSKPRVPLFRNIWKSPTDATLLGREWTGSYKGYGSFCTLNCAAAYANFMFARHGTMCVRGV